MRVASGCLQVDGQLGLESLRIRHGAFRDLQICSTSTLSAASGAQPDSAGSQILRATT